jgi:cytochrome c biogenesis protein CcdA
MSSGVPRPGEEGRTLSAKMASLARSRYFPLGVATVSVVLALPALGAGWIIDDYYHRTVMLGVSPFRELLGPPAEMFRFFRGDPEH